MTISNSTARMDYVATGAIQYDVPFWYFDASHLEVYVADEEGNQLPPSGYRVVVNPAGIGRWTTEGDDGSVNPADSFVSIYIGASTTNPLPVGHTVVILREIPHTQLTDWLSAGTVSPPSLENFADATVMALQELAERISRSPISEPTSDMSSEDFYNALTSLASQSSQSASNALIAAGEAVSAQAGAEAAATLAGTRYSECSDILTDTTAAVAGIGAKESLCEQHRSRAEDAANASDTNRMYSRTYKDEAKGFRDNAITYAQAAADRVSETEAFRDEAEAFAAGIIQSGDFYAYIGAGGFPSVAAAIASAGPDQKRFTFVIGEAISESEVMNIAQGHYYRVYVEDENRIVKSMGNYFVSVDAGGHLDWFGGNPQGNGVLKKPFIHASEGSIVTFFGCKLNQQQNGYFVSGSGMVDLNMCHSGFCLSTLIDARSSGAYTIRFTDCAIQMSRIIAFDTSTNSDGSRLVVVRSSLNGMFSQVNDVDPAMRLTIDGDIKSIITDTDGTSTHLYYVPTMPTATLPATNVTYTPTTPADWVDPDPATVQEALDILVTKSGTLGTGTTALRPATPPLGGLYFDTDLGVYICWNGTAWTNLVGGLI